MKRQFLHYIGTLIALVLSVAALVAGTPEKFKQKQIEQQASLQTVIHMSGAGPQRYVYAYEPGGRLSSLRIQRLKSGVWNDSSRTSWAYTADGKLKNEYVEQFLQGAFRSWSRSTVEYNDAGDAVSSLYEQGSWVLQPISRTLYTYLAPGKEGSRVDQAYSGSWSNVSRTTNMWDDTGRIVRSIYEQYARGRWDTASIFLTSYTTGPVNVEVHSSVSGTDSMVMTLRTDPQGHLLYDGQEQWSHGLLTWGTQSTATYDGNGRLTRILDEDLVQGVMTTTQRMTYSYDYTGNELERVRDHFSAGTWVPVWRQLSTYDASGNILSRKSYDWSESGWVAANGMPMAESYDATYVTDGMGNQYQFYHFISLTFGYEAVPTGVADGNADRPQVWSLDQNYPNPFNPTSEITYQTAAPGMVRIAVYDMLGREVAVLVNEAQEAGIHTVRFDATGLASGTYVYRMTAGSFMRSRTMVLLR